MPQLLDLFCGAGGASEGYRRAGWDVVGVDIAPQPDYPFEFMQADVFELPPGMLREFDAVHASPPCQGYSVVNRRRVHAEKRVPETIDLLASTANRWVVENVLGARHVMRGSIQLHGGHFGLDVWRPRLFSSPGVLTEPPWRPKVRTEAGVYGRKGSATFRERSDGSLLEQASVEQAQQLLGIDWTDRWDSLREAIPPVYTHCIGLQLLDEPWEHLLSPEPVLRGCTNCGGDRFHREDTYCRPCRAAVMREYRRRKRDGDQANRSGA